MICNHRNINLIYHIINHHLRLKHQGLSIFTAFGLRHISITDHLIMIAEVHFLKIYQPVLKINLSFLSVILTFGLQLGWAASLVLSSLNYFQCFLLSHNLTTAMEESVKHPLMCWLHTKCKSPLKQKLNNVKKQALTFFSSIFQAVTKISSFKIILYSEDFSQMFY